MDTIAAQATPPGRSGVAIVRVSGPLVRQIAQKVLNTLPPVRMASFLPFLDEEGEPFDQGVALFFEGPRSFTGEDVLELHGHGGIVAVENMLQRITALGARMAGPGEFSERAFLNGKVDLAQAEAIADLIDARSHHAARAAMRTLDGVFSKEIAALVEGVTQLRVFVESAIDFAEEDIDFLGEGGVAQKTKALLKQVDQIISRARQGVLLREGMSVVIAGKPNAGKSSILNRLTGVDTAIVTDIAGTTRDVLRESIQIDGLPLHVVDTAGLRASNDVIEDEGIARAKKEIQCADHVLLVIDASALRREDWLMLASGSVPDWTAYFSEQERLCFDGKPVTVLLNKVDLVGRSVPDVPGGVAFSAKTGLGMGALRARLKHAVGFESGDGEGDFIARERHLEALALAKKHLMQGVLQFEERGAGELLAEDLQQAQQALSSITGAFCSDDLLGVIFSSFCIGK